MYAIRSYYATEIDGTIGLGMNFDGTDDYILAPALTAETGDLEAVTGTSWTAFAVFAVDTAIGTDQLIISRGGGTGTGATFGLFVEQSDSYNFV